MKTLIPSPVLSSPLLSDVGLEVDKQSPQTREFRVNREICPPAACDHTI